MAKKNLSTLAKSAVSTQKNVPKNITTGGINNNVSKSTTKDERDLLAKQTVENLLSEVNIPQIGSIINNDDAVNDVVSDAVNEGVNDINEGVDQEKVWLEEQVQILNAEVQRLTFESQNNPYAQQNVNNQGFDQNQIAQSTVALYNKIQDMYDNFIRSGGTLIIYPKPFLIELESFFPYLTQYRRHLLDE